MFQGSYPLSLDAKGRMTVPAEMREQLETLCQGRLTVTRHFGTTFLRIYPQPEWERMRDIMAGFQGVAGEAARR